MPNRKSTSNVWILLAVCGLLAGLSPASAEESSWYVGGGIGPARVEARLGDRWPQFVDDEDTAFNIGVGYQLNSYLGIEAGYYDLGDHRGFGSLCRQADDFCPQTLVATEIEAEVSGFALAVVPRWPVTDRFSVYGKLGLLDWDVDVAEVDTGFGSRPIESFSDRELLKAIGVEYAVSRKLGVQLQIEESDLDFSSTSLGLRWRI